MKNQTFDILAITESKCDDTIIDSELHIDEYTIIRKDRNRQGGGVAIYISYNLTFNRLTKFECDVEAICINVTSKNIKPVTICTMYRPPNSSPTLLDSINDMVGNIVTQVNHDVIVLGDFNCDMSPTKNDNMSTSLKSIMSGLLFHQLIDIPTRVTPSSKSIIDLIFCTDPDNHSTVGVYTTSFSDHYLVFTVYGDECPKSIENVIEWRDFKHLDSKEFFSALSKQNFDKILSMNCQNSTHS